MEVTGAEQRAMKFAGRYWNLDSERYDVSIYATREDVAKYGDGSWMLAPTISVVVSIRDRLVGGSMWLSRIAVEGHQPTTKFMGGRYSWTHVGTQRRIRKSRNHLRSIVATFVNE